MARKPGALAQVGGVVARKPSALAEVGGVVARKPSALAEVGGVFARKPSALAEAVRKASGGRLLPSGLPRCYVLPVPIQFLFSSYSNSYSSSHTVFSSSYSVLFCKQYEQDICPLARKRIGTRKNCMGTGMGTGMGTEKELNRNW